MGIPALGGSFHASLAVLEPMISNGGVVQCAALCRMLALISAQRKQETPDDRIEMEKIFTVIMYDFA